MTTSDSVLRTSAKFLRQAAADLQASTRANLTTIGTENAADVRRNALATIVEVAFQLERESEGQG